MPPKIPDDATPMNPELGRRVKSFLEHKEWWNIVQTLRADQGSCEKIADFILAGLSGLVSDDDRRFANAMNWCVGAQTVGLTNVLSYDPGANWWYRPPPAAGRTKIWGYVRVMTIMTSNKGQAEANARAFASAVLHRIEAAAITASEEVGNQWEIVGEVTVT